MDYLSTAEAAAQAPRIGKRRVSANGVWRWARDGILARNGDRIRLECHRVGGRLVIPVGALEVFFKTVAEADGRYFAARDDAKTVAQRKPRPQSAAKREREIDEAETRLIQAGC